MLPDALRAMDQPSIDGVNTYAVSSALRRGGLTVALSGLGGDELFGGYSTFRRSAWLRAGPASLRQAAAEVLARIDPRLDRRERWTALGRWEPAGHPLPALRAVFSPATVARLTGGPPPSLALTEERLAVAASHDPLRQVSVLELSTYVPNTLLRDTDAMSMAHSLEIRVPYLDHQFVEWALRIPAPALGRPGSKALLQTVWQRLVPSVPPPIVKQGFVLPLATWLRGTPALQRQVDDAFREPDGWRQLGIVPDEALGVWRQFLAGRRGWAQPWALFVLRRWMETHAT